MRDQSSYDYAIVRVVPRVEREEFVNVGVIVSCPKKEFLEACLAEGALGYVLKSRMKTHLVAAIEAALKGDSYVSPFVTR